MKVIFLDQVPGVAARGDVKNVKNGYFRNFLSPRRKAAPATSQLLKEWDERRKRMFIEKEQLRSQFDEIKKRLAGVKAKIEKKVTAKGTLYGGVKAVDIVKAIKASFNVEVPAEAVVLGDHIKSVGTYDVVIRLGEGVETTLPIEVVEKK